MVKIIIDSYYIKFINSLNNLEELVKMKQEYNNLFKSLVDAYYKDEFEIFIKKTLSDPSINKNELSNIISSFCGVELKYTDNDNYIKDLRNAIKNYKSDYKIVSKIRDCSIDCADENGQTSCQKSCPFDAILIDKEKGSSYIQEDLCTDCGFCVEGCPNGSILDKVEFIPLANLLKEKKPVIAAVAPAITGQFGDNITMDQLRTAFKRVGFADMIEVAFFADMLTLKEACEFNEHVKSKDDLMITSCCCPMWVGMLKRVYNDMVKYVSPSVSPMIAAGRVIKSLNIDCKVVFIGPCIAKKAESKNKDIIGDIDFVLTFAEVKDIFESLNIKPEELPEDPSTDYASREGRLYARTGGVSISVSEAVAKLFPEKKDLFKSVQANGVKECKEILEKAQNGEASANFIEGMGCIGGCVGGPKALIPKEKGRDKVNEFAENSNVKISLESDQMKKILSKLGISSAKDFMDEDKMKIFERDF
ncbi:MAG: iron only hydrogenase large subunit [Clostridium sp.]|jgi:iron only hydrogenase large subunit-like protein|nr:iron only hydrogenase large subunit [Clostridium sp.]